MVSILPVKAIGKVAVQWGLLSAFWAGSAQAALVGQWTFEGPDPLQDRTGHFANLQLKGDAAILQGALDLNGAGTTASGWAVTAGNYSGPTITNKTLVTWLTLQSLNAWAGSALTIDRQASDEFDAVVFGEVQSNTWMAGSSFFSRTQPFTPGYQETSPGALIQMAFTYQDVGSQASIKAYRDGVLIGSYTQGPLASWTNGDAEVFFGIRHGNASAGGPGALDALIEEARIYDTALTQQAILQLSPYSAPVPGPLPLIGAWAAFRASRRLRTRRAQQRARS